MSTVLVLEESWDKRICLHNIILSDTHIQSLFRGLIREGDIMMIGPSEHGEFHKSTVTSIRRNRAPCRLIKAGQSATLALSGVDKTYIHRVSNACFFMSMQAR